MEAVVSEGEYDGCLCVARLTLRLYRLVRAYCKSSICVVCGPGIHKNLIAPSGLNTITHLGCYWGCFGSVVLQVCSRRRGFYLTVFTMREKCGSLVQRLQSSTNSILSVI